MKNKNIRPRTEYRGYIEKLNQNNICGFCSIQGGLMIEEYQHWVWIYCQFPYWKFNTLLIPKRHILKFYDLNTDELQELATTLKDIECAYNDFNLVGKKSEYGQHLIMFWRSRFSTPDTFTLSHLHLHICTEKEGAWDNILDKNAWDIEKVFIAKRGVIFILRRPDGKLLMQLRDKNSRNYVGMWCFPGGACENDENFIDTVVREIKEEYNLNIEAEECINFTNTSSMQRQVFLCNIDDNQQPELREGADMKWMTIEEIKKIKLGYNQFLIVPKLEKYLNKNK